MTWESLEEGIKRIKTKIKHLPPFSPEIDLLTIKLDKLYNCRWVMLEQKRRMYEHI